MSTFFATEKKFLNVADNHYFFLYPCEFPKKKWFTPKIQHYHTSEYTNEPEQQIHGFSEHRVSSTTKISHELKHQSRASSEHHQQIHGFFEQTRAGIEPTDIKILIG